jgi:Alginate lyase
MPRPTARLIAVAVVLLLAAPPPAHLAGRPSADSNNQVYLPIAVRPREPIGLVTTPAELRATKALADAGVEPSHTAVRKLLEDADEGLLFAPCALAHYTSEAGSDCLSESAQYAYALALAYRLTYDPRYAEHAAAILRTWYVTLVAIDPQPPNDSDQPWLDWSRLAPALTWAADLLEGAPGWTDADREQYRALLVGKVLEMGRQASTRTNNWADAGLLLRLTIAIYVDMPDERAAAIAHWKALLDYGMATDGSLIEENRRGSSGLAYNQGALSLKTVFAELLRRRGDGSLYDYRTPRGVGLKNGWDFLAPYVVSARSGVCIWPYTPDHCVNYSNKTGWEIAYARWHAPAYLLSGPIALERPYRWSDASDPGYSTLLFGNLDIGD